MELKDYVFLGKELKDTLEKIMEGYDFT